MKKENKYNIGDKFFFNNGPVEIIEIKTPEWVLVKGLVVNHTEITGANFCIPCMAGSGDGSHPRHTCHDVNDVIEVVMNDISEENIFFVNVKHLQEKPFEYHEWTKLKKENEELQLAIDEKKQIKKNIISGIKEADEFLKKQNEDIRKREIELYNLSKLIEEEEKKKIIIDEIRIIDRKKIDIKISAKTLLSYIKDSIRLGYLDAGGVDNWEWYDASMPDCDDVGEYINNEALEILFNYFHK